MRWTATSEDSAGVAVEFNRQPQRLDLSDIHSRLAKDMGLKVVISSDAYSPLQMQSLDYARRRRGVAGRQCPGHVPAAATPAAAVACLSARAQLGWRRC
jgi:hypothetical protein